MAVIDFAKLYSVINSWSILVTLTKTEQYFFECQMRVRVIPIDMNPTQLNFHSPWDIGDATRRKYSPQGRIVFLGESHHLVVVFEQRHCLPGLRDFGCMALFHAIDFTTSNTAALNALNGNGCRFLATKEEIWQK